MLSLPLLKFPVLFDSSWREQQRVPEVAPGAAFPGFPHSQGTRGSSAPSQLIPKEVLGSLPAHRISRWEFPFPVFLSLAQAAAPPRPHGRVGFPEKIPEALPGNIPA